jgi:hypothetical protein
MSLSEFTQIPSTTEIALTNVGKSEVIFVKQVL